MSFTSGIGIVVFIISLYIIWQIRQLLLLLFTAVVLANALNILVRQFQKQGVKRGYAVLISLLISVLVFILFFWIIVPPFVDQFQELADLVPQGIDRLGVWINWLATRIDPEVIELLPDVNDLAQQLQPIANQVLGGGINVFFSSLSVLLSVLLVVVLMIMFLADPQPYRQGFIRLFPAFYRRRIDHILNRCNVALQGWLIGILFNMLVIFLLSFAGLLLLGIPLALAQAMLAGVLTFIPNIGPTLSVISPMAIALIEAPWKALAVLVVYIIIQQLESNVLTPYVMAHQVSLLPVVTLASQIFFATFFGFLGLFVALPLTIVGQIWIKEILIRDILDQWQSRRNYNIDSPEVESVIVSSPEESSSISDYHEDIVD